MSGLNPNLTESWRAEVAGHAIDLAWSPDGETLAVASIEGPVSIFSRSGVLLQELPGHRFGTCTISWNGDGSLLASAGQDGKSRVWEPHSGQERFAVEAGSAWVEHVAWSRVGPYLATGAGRKLNLWDADGGLVQAYPDQPGTITGLAWKPGQKELASASYGCLAIWSPEVREPLRSFSWKGAMLALAWSRDGRTIATGDQDATVHLWDVRTGKDLMMWGYRTKVRELSWDATGRYLATGGGPSATVWDCSGRGPEGSEPAILGDPGETQISAVAFRSSGPILATADLSGRLRVWRLTGIRGDRLGKLNLEDEITQIAWHPSGRSLAAGTAIGTVVLVETPWL
ncbi:MAG: hypothetical protein JWN86_4751 [Planctomycetota bacterium]|nr:hypothetical protein [Planctomycetota bacterium]